MDSQSRWATWFGYSQCGGPDGSGSNEGNAGTALRAHLPSVEPRISSGPELPDGDRRGEELRGRGVPVGGGYRPGEFLQPGAPPEVDVAACAARVGPEVAGSHQEDAP